MRRLLPLLLLVAVALAGAPIAVRGATATGQEATPAVLPPVVAEWAAAMAAHDPDRVLALYAADAVWEEVAIGLIAQGTAEIRTHLELLFAATPDIAFAVTGSFATGDRAAAEWTVTGTLTGDFPGLPPGTGQRFTFRGASIYELEGGQITHYTEYWDAYVFLVQLGALPTPAGAGSPAATPAT